MSRSKTFLFLSILTLSSCSQVEPAGFWTEFDKPLLSNDINDQGPWGGNRALHWTAYSKGSFDTNKILDYASKNGWTLIDSTDHTSKELKHWTFSGKPIFPLAHTGFMTQSTSNNSTFKKFPRWITSDAKVYHFRTGWISIQPGTDDSYEINGFVMVNNDRDQMSVYHLWGE